MHDVKKLTSILARLCRPLSPQPVAVQEKRCPLSDVRAVCFDIYGTLLISASGDIGLSREEQMAQAAEQSLQAMGVEVLRPHVGAACADLFRQTILARHAESRCNGVEHPEVDICVVWSSVLEALVRRGDIVPVRGGMDVEALAVDYECRSNPVWPMPGALELLAALRQKGMKLGIVSNAQFYTPLVLEALLGNSLAELGFASDLLVWSCQWGMAKPARALFQVAAERLKQGHALHPSQVLYVGNDMEKDILPARVCGFHTALFAGDARSYRPGTAEGTAPDLLVSDLRHIIPLLAG